MTTSIVIFAFDNEVCQYAFMNTMIQKKSARTYAGKSKMERHSERFEKLIEAGIEVIGTSGFAAASVKSVCSAAGLTERYFYESFTNREELLVKTYQEANERIRKHVRRELQAVADKPKLLLKTGVKAFYQILSDDPRLARIVLFEAVERAGKLAEIKREAEQEFVHNFKNALMLYSLKSKLPEEQETLVILGIFGAGVNIAMRWVLDDFRQSPEDISDSLIVIIEAIYEKTCK